MKVQRIGTIMNGVTGRMGLHQHLVRSILAIRAQGGVALEDGSRLMPDPILVGRNAAKLEQIAKEHGIARWTSSLNQALSDPGDAIYFDAQLTALRAPGVEAAIQAGKHIYCEKPLAVDSKTALALAGKAKAAGVKAGIVQDKLFLPGIGHAVQFNVVKGPKGWQAADVQPIWHERNEIAGFVKGTRFSEGYGLQPVCSVAESSSGFSS